MTRTIHHLIKNNPDFLIQVTNFNFFFLVLLNHTLIPLIELLFFEVYPHSVNGGYGEDEHNDIEQPEPPLGQFLVHILSYHAFLSGASASGIGQRPNLILAWFNDISPLFTACFTFFETSVTAGVLFFMEFHSFHQETAPVSNLRIHSR